ncbi:hypothetical protein GCM10027294_19830 [Marinactinospora endophytica]
MEPPTPGISEALTMPPGQAVHLTAAQRSEVRARILKSGLPMPEVLQDHHDEHDEDEP